MNTTIRAHRSSRWLRAALLCVGLLVSAVPTWSHHAFATEFDIKKPVTLRGTLTKIDWINPHAWLHIDVKDEKAGTVTNWAIEFGAPITLMRKGLRAGDFQVGGILEIQGYLAKSGRPVANAVSVKLPDGRDFFTGSSAPAPAGK